MDALLWRSAFYRFIEDYRKRIRKFAGAVAANVTGAQATLDKVGHSWQCDVGCSKHCALRPGKGRADP